MTVDRERLADALLAVRWWKHAGGEEGWTSGELADALLRAGVSLTGSGLREAMHRAIDDAETVGWDDARTDDLRNEVVHAAIDAVLYAFALSGESGEPKEPWPDHADMSVDERR